jgi:hypothetical protein
MEKLYGSPLGKRNMRFLEVPPMKKSDLAKAIVAYSFRNTSLEDIHAGISPVSYTGDYSDVFVVDASGRKIPWDRVSRISDDEMKELMQTAVDRVYAVLSREGDAGFEEQVLNHALTYTRNWDEPREEE